MKTTKLAVMAGATKQAVDVLNAIELEAGDCPTGNEGDLFFGATFSCKDSLKSAGLWFVKVGKFAAWAKPEVAKQIRRVTEIADRCNTQTQVLTY